MFHINTRSDPHVIMTLEKAIMRGKPVILKNCEEHVDNIITPLIHHRNTADQDETGEGKCVCVCVCGEGGGEERNCEEHVDNIITPLIHHRNTADQDETGEGKRLNC